MNAAGILIICFADFAGIESLQLSKLQQVIHHTLITAVIFPGHTQGQHTIPVVVQPAGIELVQAVYDFLIVRVVFPVVFFFSGLHLCRKHIRRDLFNAPATEIPRSCCFLDRCDINRINNLLPVSPTDCQLARGAPGIFFRCSIELADLPFDRFITVCYHSRHNLREAFVPPGRLAQGQHAFCVALIPKGHEVHYAVYKRRYLFHFCLETFFIAGQDEIPVRNAVRRSHTHLGIPHFVRFKIPDAVGSLFRREAEETIFLFRLHGDTASHGHNRQSAFLYPLDLPALGRPVFKQLVQPVPFTPPRSGAQRQQAVLILLLPAGQELIQAAGQDCMPFIGRYGGYPFSRIRITVCNFVNACGDNVPLSVCFFTHYDISIIHNPAAIRPQVNRLAGRAPDIVFRLSVKMADFPFLRCSWQALQIDHEVLITRVSHIRRAKRQHTFLIAFTPAGIEFVYPADKGRDLLRFDDTACLVD